MSNLSVRTLHDLTDIKAADWDACANPVNQGVPYNPFLSHAFLAALETSGCVTGDTGWQPFHLLAEDAEGALLGVAPAYLKAHSQGEFVFDHSWASALHQMGEQYYPKLQISVPFTPVTGTRLLVHPDAPCAEVEEALLQSCIRLCRQLGLSSAHITFMPENQWRATQKFGYLQRMDQQYYWLNKGYASFDEFLSDLSSKKRKNFKRERREALQADISIEWLTGDDLTEQHWDVFYRFYMDTGSRKWGSPYLNRTFFSLICAAMPAQILLMLCKRAGRYIAGALHFIGGDALYGRYWGCLEDHRFLHFETCYYQAIDFAIERGLKRVEAGAQGGHKFIRGYLPCPTFSAHWIENPGFRSAVDRFLTMERAQVRQEIEAQEAYAPYKKTLDLSGFYKAGGIKIEQDD